MGRRRVHLKSKSGTAKRPHPRNWIQMDGLSACIFAVKTCHSSIVGPFSKGQVLPIYGPFHLSRLMRL